VVSQRRALPIRQQAVLHPRLALQRRALQMAPLRPTAPLPW
jgi:hypothetical protein